MTSFDLISPLPWTRIADQPSRMPTTGIKTAMGAPIPAHLPHGISVSLPTWKDNVGYEEGDPRVIDQMKSGYPRFFINLQVQRVRR